MITGWLIIQQPDSGEPAAHQSDPDISTEQIDSAVRQNPALVYRLLRIANSASTGTQREVASIRDALIMVGRNRLRSWLVLLSLSGDKRGGSRSGENLAVALTRARTCELLARAAGSVNPDAAFTAGLLDGLTDALNLTPTMLLQRMPALSIELSDTLFGGPSPLRQVLDTVLAFEAGQLDQASGLASGLCPERGGPH